ncbi:hypothetical protein [Tahibacter caeni]|uniref:hypothetical protein n=1 Tax=Tahibacter caeni TaxID=1453545 RepID=UPI0021474C7A|nr:hypothetical protein [Tahibacter caeni]
MLTSNGKPAEKSTGPGVAAAKELVMIAKAHASGYRADRPLGCRFSARKPPQTAVPELNSARTPLLP